MFSDIAQKHLWCPELHGKNYKNLKNSLRMY